MPENSANATCLGDDVEPRLCDWHRGPAEYNLTTTNVLLPSHFEGVWGIPPAAGGKQAFQKSKRFSVVPRGLAGIHFFNRIFGVNHGGSPFLPTHPGGLIIQSMSKAWFAALEEQEHAQAKEEIPTSEPSLPPRQRLLPLPPQCLYTASVRLQPSCPLLPDGEQNCRSF